jgi:hypothetical protein
VVAEWIAVRVVAEQFGQAHTEAVVGGRGSISLAGRRGV